MREIAAATLMNSAPSLTFCCEPPKKITECACTLREANPVRVYMKKQPHQANISAHETDVSTIKNNLI